MSTSFSCALTAARQAAAAQHYPEGALYVVATPIGNLADITLRTLHVLQLVDALACEDTRHTQSLLRAYGLERPPAHWVALHQHNEVQVATALIERLRIGQRIAYVSDAGTPCISDPGARLVAAVRCAGLRCIPLPGASSVTCALSVAGSIADTARDSGFVFVGFLPAKGSERAASIGDLADEKRCSVVLEAPHRMLRLAAEIAVLGERQITLARELTKQFEEITSCRADALALWLAASPQRSRGEFVLVVHSQTAPAPAPQESKVLHLLLQELPVKTAVRLAAEITQTPKNTLYRQALSIKGDNRITMPSIQ